MFGIKWNNKLKPSKVKKPNLLSGFDQTPRPRQPTKAYDIKPPKPKNPYKYNDGESM